MSGNNYTCRDKYYNYGSYLRSRGFDKELCNLLNDITAGLSNIGPIQPGNCENGTPTIISGDVIIEPCENDIDNSTGTLKIYGGNSTNPSIETTGGASFIGDVIVRGNLAVTGYVEDLSAVSILEALEIDTITGYEGESFAIYQSPGAIGNMEALWTDISSNTTGVDAWKKNLGFAIDGPYSLVANSDGATDESGHVRGMRGATFMNPPATGTDIDVNYERNIANSDNALDVYGVLNVSSGNNSAPAVIDIQDGMLSIYDGTTENVNLTNDGNGTFAGLINVYDLSVNNHASIYDLSVVNLMTVGTSTTYINTDDVSANTIHTNEVHVDDLFVQNTFSINDLSINDLSVNNINIYNDFLVSKNIVFDSATPHDIQFNTGLSSVGRILNNGQLDVRSTNGTMVVAAAGDLDLESSQAIDLSANTIRLNQNPEIKFSGVSDPFSLFGVAKTVMNMTPILDTLTNGTATTLLNFPTTLQQNVFFSNYPSGTFSNGSSTINISTNTNFFNNCIIELSVSLECSFDQNADGLRCTLIDSSTIPNKFEIDTRSVAKGNPEQIVFGPISFYTTPYVGDIDTSKDLKILLERAGNSGTISGISNVRLNMTTTKIA